MLISNRKIYENINCSTKGKLLISEYFNVVFKDKSLTNLVWTLKDKSVKNNYNYINLLVDTQVKDISCKNKSFIKQGESKNV